MKPKPQPRDSFELFQAHFDQMLNPGHELIQLARKIDWPAQAAADLAIAASTPGTTIVEKVAPLGYYEHGMSEELGPHQ